MTAARAITRELTEDEALVLFEWVAHFNQRQNEDFADQAEQRVLWDLEATLESQLADPLGPEYQARVEAARGRVRDQEE